MLFRELARLLNLNCSQIRSPAPLILQLCFNVLINVAWGSDELGFRLVLSMSHAFYQPLLNRISLPWYLGLLAALLE